MYLTRMVTSSGPALTSEGRGLEKRDQIARETDQGKLSDIEA